MRLKVIAGLVITVAVVVAGYSTLISRGSHESVTRPIHVVVENGDPAVGSTEFSGPMWVTFGPIDNLSSGKVRLKISNVSGVNIRAGYQGWIDAGRQGNLSGLSSGFFVQWPFAFWPDLKMIDGHNMLLKSGHRGLFVVGFWLSKSDRSGALLGARLSVSAPGYQRSYVLQSHETLCPNSPDLQHCKIG